MKKLLTIIGLISAVLSANAFKQTVAVSNVSFTPSTFTINLGDTVEWTWVNGTHTSTSLSVPGNAVAWDQPIDAAHTSFIYVPADTGTYNYKCTFHFSLGMVGTFDVVCPQVSVTISAPSGTSFCTGGSVNLISSASGNAATYVWSRNGIEIPGATASSYTATIAGTYSLSAANNCGSASVSNSINITVNSLPPATITPSGPTTFCSGSNALTLTANSGTGFTYQWKKGTANVSGATNISYMPTTSGTYKVRVTNPQGCNRTSSTGVTATVNALPAAAITPTGPTTFCSGTNPLTLTANTGTGYTYQWKKGATAIAGATNQTYIPTSTSPTYKVTVTNPSGCSKTSAVIAVTVNPLPTATITPQGPTTFCAGDSVILQAPNGAGLAYQWRKGNADISGATLQNYAAKSGGTFKVIVTNTNGCSKTSAGVIVTINCRTGIIDMESNLMNIYPNPSDRLFHITLPGYNGAPMNISVKDMKGATVFNQLITGREFEFGENLIPGIYFVELIKDNKLIAWNKIVKSKE
jgi:plastocyanin